MSDQQALWIVPQREREQVKQKARVRALHTAPLTSTNPCIVHLSPVEVPEERQSLLDWAKQHSYPRQPFLFNTKGRAYGYVAAGEEHWRGFLAWQTEENVALV